MVSIIIPNYNNGKYIVQCLDSIKNQTYKNIEIIIIDDGSTDDSVRIIKDYISSNRLSINLIIQYNQNAAIARNEGLKLAKGDYVYFLDSDDYIFGSTTISDMVNEFNDNDLVIGKYCIVSGDKNIDEYNPINDFYGENEIFKYVKTSPVPSNKLYSMNLIKKYNIYFDNVRIGQDLNFFLKYLSICKKIKFMESNIYYYRVLSTSMSRKTNLNFLDIVNSFAGIKKFYLKQGKEKLYEKYICYCELYHYKSQAEKIKKLSSRKLKESVFKYFDYFISNIDFSKVDNKKIYMKEYNKYRIKRFFKHLYYFR